MDISVQQSRTSTKKWSKIMKFGNLVEKCDDFMLAVKLQENRLSQDQQFLDGLTFEQCIYIFSDHHIGNEQLKKMVFCQLSKCEPGVDKWFELYSRTFSHHELKNLALRKIGECTQTFTEWLELYKHSRVDDPVEELIFQQMSKCKPSFDELLAIYQDGDTAARVKDLAFQKMRELANQDD